MVKTFGRWLSERRYESGLSQENLARVLGVSRTTLSAWENDIQDARLRADQWVKFCGVLNVKMTEIPR